VFVEDSANQPAAQKHAIAAYDLTIGFGVAKSRNILLLWRPWGRFFFEL
jgi:hypothetical protein